MDNLFRALIALSGLFFGAVCLFYVTSYWSDVPYVDYWLSVPYAERWLSGQLHLVDFLRHSGGHRSPFGSLVEIASIQFTRHDPRTQMALGYGFLVMTAAVLVWAFRANLRKPTWQTALIFTAIFGMIFSLRNWDNLLSPWSINNSGTFLFFILSLLFIDRNTRLSDACAFVCALIASTIFTNGILVWPIGFIYALVIGRRRLAAVWAIGGVLFFGALAFGSGEFADFASRDPMIWLGMLIALLGAPFLLDSGIISAAATTWPALFWLWVAFGVPTLVALVCTIPILFDLERLRAVRLPIAIIAFGVGSCIMIVAGRSSFGVGQAFAARYYCVASVILIGLMLLALQPLPMRESRNLKAAAVFLAIFSLVAQSVALEAELRVGPHRRIFMDGWRQAVLNYRTASDADLRGPHFTPDMIRGYAATLDRYHLHPF